MMRALHWIALALLSSCAHAFSVPAGLSSRPAATEKRAAAVMMKQQPKKVFGDKSDLYGDLSAKKSSGFKNPFGSEKERYADLSRIASGKAAPAPKKTVTTKNGAPPMPGAYSGGGVDTVYLLGGCAAAFAAVLAYGSVVN